MRRRTFPDLIESLRSGTGEPLVRQRRRRRSRVRELQPQMAQALRLLRAAGRLGVPGALPGPPELLPMGARVLAQGYLNRFAMPVLNGWLIPRWMREQSDPASTHFTPRSVLNLMVNQTSRNWTALGIPGGDHPVESIVDRWGLLTPVPGGPSLDWWVDVNGSDTGRMAPSLQKQVTQSLQGSLPVVLTAYEAEGLRVSSEAWALPTEDGDWAAMQVVLFNIADMKLEGTFSFALRPYNSEGISPINTIAFDGFSLRADARPPLITWPQPESWALSSLREGDLFRIADSGRQTTDERRRTRDDGREFASSSRVRKLIESSQAHIAPNNQYAIRGGRRTETQYAIENDPHGFAHGVLQYSFSIEPWEEAEFLAFTPIHTPRKRRTPHHKPIFGVPTVNDHANSAATPLNPQHSILSTQFYSRTKASTTLQWRQLLDSGMRVSLPHRELQLSWEASRMHVLALHDGDEITPGPDIYHNFWFRDAVYMTYALSICGYMEAAEQLLRGFAKRQRREGAFVSHSGEWDSTGQVIWVMAQHLALHPDSALQSELAPAIERGARWIARTLANSPDGLMPPGISSEHFGPPDRYYWDDLWSLAGLEAAYDGRRTTDDGRQNVRRERWGKAAGKLRRALDEAWGRDAARLEGDVIPAAPGRGVDLGMVGTLAAWFPLQLLSADDPRLKGTLAALEGGLFHEGALFVNTGHSGWSSYLNMRVAGCRLMQGSPEGWRLMKWLLRHASPTYTWPEAIHPRSGGGSAGDGQHGWASAEWLMLVRAMLIQESDDTLLITPTLPEEWLEDAGRITVENAPTRFGPVSFNIEWDDGGETLNLKLEANWRTPPSSMSWRAPGVMTTIKPDWTSATLTRPK